MLESASMLSFFLAFALLHAADPARFPARRRKPTRELLRTMRLGAMAPALAGVVFWTKVEGLAAALIPSPADDDTKDG